MALVSRNAAGLILGLAGLAMVGGVSSAVGLGFPPPAPKAGEAAAKTPRKVLITFKDGKQLTGLITSETASVIKFKGEVNKIPFETELQRDTIIAIQDLADEAPAAADPGTKKAEEAKPQTTEQKPKDAATENDSVRVYFIDLSGKFGEDISQSPVRQAFKDAKANNADYVIVTLNAEWSQDGFGELPNDAGAFDEIFRAVEMENVFNSEIKREWDTPPQMVFWVKQAMGGASMLPLLCKTIYFAPEARMGGIGNLSEILKGVDEVVRQKQISLRISQAEGLAIVGGYDPVIVDAMAKSEFVLSYTFENGKVKFLQRMPEGPNEFLLTDDAKDPNKDDIKALARGEGNDVLTLTPEVAQKIGISKGTVSTMDDLLFELGISRNAVKVDGRSKVIMEGWKKQIEKAKRDLKDDIREFSQIQVNGATYADRTRQRGQQKAKLQDMLSIYKRFGEGISPSWRARNRVPQESDLLTMIQQIELQQAQDKK